MSSSWAQPASYLMASRYGGYPPASQHLLTHNARNPYSSLSHRDPRSSSSLFDGAPGADKRSRRGSAHSPARPGYGYNGSSSSPYLQANGSGQMNGGATASFRPATPNSKYACPFDYSAHPQRARILMILLFPEASTPPPSSKNSSPRTKTPRPPSSPRKSPNSNNSPWPSATRSETRVRLQNRLTRLSRTRACG